MRPLWIPLVAAALLAGCTAEPAPATDPEAAPSDPASAEAVAQAFGAGSASQLPALRFAAGEYNATRTVEGSFPSPNTCFIQGCPEQTLTFDLTADVPADAPVDLTLTLDSAACVDAWIEVEDNGSTRSYHDYASSENFAVRLVRTASGMVTLRLDQCSLFAGDLVASSVPVTAEIRSVVRPTSLPTYLPVAIDLAIGDRLLGMGDALDDLVVVPPGRDPVHLVGPFTFNVTGDLPAGRYVVVALGGSEAMLHGTPQGSLQALPLRSLVTDPQAVVSGQDWVQDVPIPGVPLYAGLVINSQDNAADNSAMSFIGDHTVTFTQDGADLGRYENTGCVASCSLTVFGYFSRSYPMAYLPEGLGPGTLSVTLTNQASNAVEAYVYAGYVEP